MNSHEVIPATRVSSALPTEPLISTTLSKLPGTSTRISPAAPECVSSFRVSESRNSITLSEKESFRETIVKPSTLCSLFSPKITDVPISSGHKSCVLAIDRVTNVSVVSETSRETPSAASALPISSKAKESSPPHKIFALYSSSTQVPSSACEPILPSHLTNNFTNLSTETGQNCARRHSDTFLVIPVTDSPQSPPAKLDVCRRSSLVADSLLSLHLSLEFSPEAIYGEVIKAVKNLQITWEKSDECDRHLLVTQLISKDGRLLPRLFSALGSCGDHQLVGLVCEFLHGCLSPTTNENVRQKLITALVHHNVAEVLFRIFRSYSSCCSPKEETALLHGFEVIAKLASKDPKLAVKCRLVGGVKLTHQLIQNHAKNFTLLHPLLLVLKALVKNPTNQVVLGKDGCVATLISLLNSVPKTHWTKIKLILENLHLLTKTTFVSPRLAASIRAGGQKIQTLLNCFFESNVVRLVKENGLARLLSILDSWEKIEKRQQIKVLRALFAVLSHLCDSKHGRKAVAGLHGVDILHRFIVACPTDHRSEFLIGSALNVLLKCVSKGEIPVASLKGAITFASRESCPQLPDSHEVTPYPDQESSDDEEEDGEDEEDISSHDKGIDLATEYNPDTTRLEDLVRMGVFFPELQNQHLGAPFTGRRSSLGGRNGKGDNAALTGEASYLNMSSNTKSLINFVKVAYPDMVGAQGPDVLEPLYQKNAKVHREKALRTVDRALNAGHYKEKVVYDLDYLLESDHTHQLIDPSATPGLRILSNWDERRIGKKDVSINHLNFESRFESGNLRRAIQVAPYEYDLLLNADVNSWHHHQWFYFEVSGMEAGVPYIFNIINNEKPNSEFNFGMKPVLFSVREAQLGRCCWVRTGSDICYQKNHYVRFPKTIENPKFRKSFGKNYYTATISIKFPHSNDVVYLAYHYTYTYTKLQLFLHSLEFDFVDSSSMYYRNQTLCTTENGNSVPLITVTSNTKKSQEKDIIFLTARVHPGESNSSWVMQGVIKFLMGCSEEARTLRDTFIFKIVPMLNPEGVIHGNQRCGLTDEDLNRRWRSPDPYQHPTIYYTKALIEHLAAVVGKAPRVFCDFHGHSRQKNLFMYGCSHQRSWCLTDKAIPDDDDIMLLPHLAQRYMPAFSLRDCRFHVERARESTARVAVWRQFNVTHSFTMEASTCGCDSGIYKNYHLSPRLLLESGEGFCRALHHFGCLEVSDIKSAVNSRRASWIHSCDNSDDQVHVESDENDMDSEAELDYDLYGSSE